MKTLLICKDCGDQLESSHPDGKSIEIQEIAAKNNQVNVFLTNCMGICPTNKKISSIVLNQNITNSVKVRELTATDIDEMIKTKEL